MSLYLYNYPLPGNQEYGQMTGKAKNTHDNSDTKNHKAKYYSKHELNEIIRQLANKIASSKVKVTNTTFANLPDPSATNLGDIYNITDQFTSDERFSDGAGIVYYAGTNVIVVESENGYKFDALMAGIDEADQSGIDDIINSL